MSNLKNMPESYWKRKLTPGQYSVLKEKGTEPPFTGAFLKNQKNGMYLCGACGARLFSSNAKYESGTGWPSFWEAVDGKNIELEEDKTLGMSRIEVKCSNCGSHLGHLFNDGPKVTPDGNPCTGKRYCINSIALDFKPEGLTKKTLKNLRKKDNYSH